MLSEETVRLKNLIEDVLDFSRLMENRQPYRRDRMDLVNLARDTVERFRHSHETDGVQISFKSTVGEGPILGDAEALRRVLLNLLDNAVKYSPPDHIRIRVELQKEDNSILLIVSDEGYGISKEEQTLVFDRFYRGRSASEYHSTNGTGLGLSIVQHIVTAHEGRIKLQSALGKGSIFSIQFSYLGAS